MKQALIVASFGTTHDRARDQAIGGIEQALGAAFPQYRITRAFTSSIVMKRLAERGIQVDTLPQAIERLRKEGFDNIGVVSTHVVAGIEYEKVLAACEGLPCTTPLLHDIGDDARVAQILGGVAERQPGTTLFMGHGTEHAANERYERLSALLAPSVHLACAEGGLSLEALLPQLDVLENRHITLVPLMIVAGDHACNDLAGEDADSWKSILSARGMAVSVLLRGLGEMPEIQRLFVEKAASLWA